MKFTPYIWKTKEEIQDELLNVNKKYKKLQSECNNLKQQLETAEKVLISDDLRETFYNLKDGLSEIHERVNNPICKWERCDAGKFNCITELINHFDIEHTSQHEQSLIAPVKESEFVSGINVKS